MIGGRRFAAVLLLAAFAPVIGSCVKNPVTGQRQFTLISEGQEIRMGQSYDPQIVAQMGLYPDSALQRYVHELGSRMAAASERPHLPWTFRVLDDPVVNAFALPGGFNYVTRGILAFFESEAELAAVLGHEIGHVTARHSVSRMSTQQLAQIGLAVGTVIRPDMAGLADVAGAGLGLLFLKHSRDDERQADELGLRYMVDAGYDPREMPGVYAMLEAVSQAEGAGRVPEWLATHPNPENRRGRIEQQIAALGRDFDGAVVGRDRFLDRIHGMIYGPNPREGFFRENRFFHPDLAFRFEFPAGWSTSNQKQVVFAVSPDRDGVVQISLAEASTADAAARAFFAQDGVSAGTVSRSRINGLPAVAGDFIAVSQQGGRLAGSAAFIELGGRVYQILGYAADTRWRAYESATRRSIASFDRLTDPADLAVQPLRLEIVRLDRAMSFDEFLRRYPTPVSADRIALLNRVPRDARFAAGERVKRVVGELP